MPVVTFILNVSYLNTGARIRVVQVYRGSVRILEHISLYADFGLLVLTSLVTITVVYFIVRFGIEIRRIFWKYIVFPRSS
jgi:hypothetical protein